MNEHQAFVTVAGIFKGNMWLTFDRNVDIGFGNCNSTAEIQRGSVYFCSFLLFRIYRIRFAKHQQSCLLPGATSLIPCLLVQSPRFDA